MDKFRRGKTNMKNKIIAKVRLRTYSIHMRWEKEWERGSEKEGAFQRIH